ncbi:hypothetical protein KLP42_18270 [Rhizobium sp. CSW-27]|nr:hypothetical protein [Rhizobium sp. CSW-27]
MSIRQQPAKATDRNLAQRKFADQNDFGLTVGCAGNSTPAGRRTDPLPDVRCSPPPAPDLWLACGIQARQEHTGVSDQNNCTFINNRVTSKEMAYFTELACFVSTRSNECG